MTRMDTLKACIERRHLLWYMVKTNIKLSKKDLMLGYAWWLLEPLLLAGVYWLLIVVIFQRGEPNFFLFMLCGLIPFRAVTVSLMQAATSMRSNASLLSQINFPRIFVPLSKILANHIKLIVALMVVLVIALLSGSGLTLNSSLLVIPFFLQMMMVSGLAFMLAIIGVYLPDIRNVLQFLLHIWLYLSPVLYSLERIPERWRDVFLINPLAPIVLMYRDVILFGHPPQMYHVEIALFEGILLVVLGYRFFSNRARTLLKYL